MANLGADDISNGMVAGVSALLQESLPRVVIHIVELYLIQDLHCFDASAQSEVIEPGKQLVIDKVSDAFAHG